MARKGNKLGIALAGGGVRGLVQVPLLGALQKAGVEPNYIAGTSIGSILATFYALDIPAEEIKNIFVTTAKELVENHEFMKPSPMLLAPTKNKLNGAVSGQVIEDRIAPILEQYGVENIMDVKKKLLIVSVDTVTKKVVYFTNDLEFTPRRDAIVIHDISLAKAIRSSCSYPGIVAANQIGELRLADGGLRMNLPVEPLYDMGASRVLSLTMTKGEKIKSTKSAIKTALRSIDIMFDETMLQQMMMSDLNLDLQVGDIHAFDFSDTDNIYSRGVEYAEAYSEAVLEFCKPKKVCNKIRVALGKVPKVTVPKLSVPVALEELEADKEEVLV